MELRNNKQHKITEGPKCISELRQDLVGGDWMIVATGRAKRPNSFTGGRQKFEQNISQCPFEDPQATGHGEPLLIYYQGGQKWSLQVIKNKFPALGQGDCSKTYKEGPYTLMDGTGFHEIIITRDHKKHLALMSIEKVEEVLGAYQERYLMLMDHKCVNYIFVFHNHGKEAGATIPHPHTLPPGLSLTHTPFPLGLSLTQLPTHPSPWASPSPTYPPTQESAIREDVLIHCDGQHFTLLRQPVEPAGPGPGPGSWSGSGLGLGSGYALRSLDDILAAAQAADLVVQINPTTSARKFSLFGILAEP